MPFGGSFKAVRWQRMARGKWYVMMWKDNDILPSLRGLYLFFSLTGSDTQKGCRSGWSAVWDATQQPGEHSGSRTFHIQPKCLESLLEWKSMKNTKALAWVQCISHSDLTGCKAIQVFSLSSFVNLLMPFLGNNFFLPEKVLYLKGLFCGNVVHHWRRELPVLGLIPLRFSRKFRRKREI